MAKNPSLESQEMAFLSAGFRNWKKGIEKFRTHENSAFHKKSVEIAIQRQQGTPVISQVVQHSLSEQQKARAALLVIVSSLRYLARTGSGVRGHEAGDGNLMSLLEERAGDVPELKAWLKRRDNWLAPTIQNEILEILAHMVQRDIVDEIKRSPFYAIMADSTTDMSGLEQFTLCVRSVDPSSLVVKELFTGLYNPPDSTAATLAASIKDILLRLTLSTQNLRGHCFDGAANMSGRLHGVRKIMSDEQPKSPYIHCSNHSLDLALQEISRKSDAMCEVMTIVKDVSNVILESAKRKNMYMDIVLEPCDGGPNPRVQRLIPLCPTRWAVRVKSLSRFQENYERVLKTLEEILSTPGAVADGRKAALKGFAKRMKKLETMFFLTAAIKIFGPCEQLARALQSPQYSAAGVKKAVEMLIRTLSDLRTQESFDQLLREARRYSEEMDIELTDPLQRVRKPPRRLEATYKPTPPVQLDLNHKLRQEFYAVVDRLVNEVQRRFTQDGFDMLLRLEEILVVSAKGKAPSSERLEVLLGIHASDFSLDQLRAQLLMLPTITSGLDPCNALSIGEKIGCESSTVRDLMNQVVRLVILVLTVPTSAATSERSFSGLRRLKTYLRSTMSQSRLTHLMVLHVHQERTAALDLVQATKEFVSRTTERKVTFGNI